MDPMDVLKAAVEIVEEKKKSIESQEVTEDKSAIIKSMIRVFMGIYEAFYGEKVQDAIVIFVSDDWQANAFWKNLKTSEVIKSIGAISDGLNDIEE